MAKKLGFDAYGATKDMPDPIVQSLNKMLDHMHHVDERISQISELLNEQGREHVIPPLEPCELDTLDDSDTPSS